MQKLHHLNYISVALLCPMLPNAALAQQPYADTPYEMISRNNPSVDIYSLDGPPPAPQDYVASPRVMTSAPVQSTSVETVAADSKTMAFSSPGGWMGAKWSGRANIGASLQTGNTEQDAINADGVIQAKWGDIHRATLKAEYNRETEDGDTTEDNRSIEGLYDYFFAPKWFINTNAKFEQDDISDIDLRYNIGVGLGHQVFESDDLNLQYVLGPTYLREEFEDGSSDDSIAARWAFDYDQKVLENRFQLFHEHELLVPTDETDAFLFDSKSGVRIPIIHGIVGTAEVDFDWDNDPEPGIKEDDTTYAIKIGYEWD